jgi:choline dehydrogenase-like flavoprotein
VSEPNDRPAKKGDPVSLPSQRDRLASSRRALLLGGLVLGGAAIGGFGAVKVRQRLRHRQPSGQAPEFQGHQARIADLRDALPLDVCIIGSGPAGSVLGIQLARAGLRTAILEAGVNPSEMAKNEKFALINQATMSGDQPYAVAATRAMMPGGTSALWTGNTPRLVPIDFEQNAYTPKGAHWPVTYAEMDPYYERAEASLYVTGESNVRYVPPRTHPLANERRGGNRVLKGMLRDVGVVAFDTFRSRMPDGGPTRVARDVLPKFVAQPTAAFVSGVSARRLLSDKPDRIDGLLVRNIDGDASVVRAKVFVVAAGGVESARLLLLSKSEYFPNGLGNTNDLLGRTFADHQYFNFTSQVRDPRRIHWEELPQVVRSFQFYERFKRKGLGSLGLTASILEQPSGLELKMTAECELEPHADNRITLDPDVLDPWGDPVAHLRFSVSERDRQTRAEASRTIISLMQRMGGQKVEALPSHWGHHHLGTVRMGHSERDSVVDRNLRIHGMRNAFVLTSGNFVTSGPANPTLLIAAFAHRLADHLIEEFRQGAFGTDSTLARLATP